jgi:ribosome biogenesis protein SSF1/2
VTAVCLSVYRDLSACLQGRSARNNIQANAEEEPEELKQALHSFVIHRSSVGGYVIELTRDFRKVMEPFTASCLKVNGLQVAH